MAVARVRNLVSKLAYMSLEFVFRGEYARSKDATLCSPVEITVLSEILEGHVPIRVQWHSHLAGHEHISAIEILDGTYGL